jgi:serine/threonine protein kinase
MVAAAPSRVRFGDYDIERKLGHGMTDVYVAFDPVRERRLVLKLIRLSDDPAARQVIEAERRGARIQQQLHAFDPRIIEVYDYGDREGCFFVAMAYVEGDNVAGILRREQCIDPIRAARIALEIASQLEALHSFQAQIDGRAAAVVHGDIKPSNIHLGADGRIRLLDFGIAKCVTLLHNLTMHEFGSPNYCSPERLGRAQIDTDADLWALGVTLYEMVAGSPPYQAESTQKLENLIQSRRPPRALPGFCPRGLKAIIGKALAAEASQRYGTAAIFREDLAAFLENRPTVAERERRRPWRVSPTVESGGSGDRWWSRIPYIHIAGALGCVLLGMAVFLGTAYYWRSQADSIRFRDRLDFSRRDPREIGERWEELQRLRRDYSFLGRYSPVHGLDAPLRASYVAAADNVIDAYRAGNQPAIEKFDWRKAEIALERAVAMNGADPAARGKLALARGYLDLAASQPRETARAHFEEAAKAWPLAPDPHLALARLFAYAFRDTDLAIAELTKAEALGYALQPREIEQKADAFRFRAWKELGEAWSAGTRPADAIRLVALGQRDLETAEALYQPIRGFGHVDAHLHQVKAVYAKTLPAPPAPAPKPVTRRARSRSRAQGATHARHP